jgi:dTDP-4-dehydrorhamnose reductase
MKRFVIVTGVAGQLGYDVVNELFKRGVATVGTDIKSEEELTNKANWDNYYRCDITDKEQVNSLFNKIKPDAIIHCAAWTNVDGAEDPNNKPLVKRINADGTENLVKAARATGAKFLYISTDYVFNGAGTKPWSPDDKDYSPLNYYGKTKLEGELSVSSLLKKYFIVRIAWVFGLNGNNFIKTMLKLADKGYKELRVVDDQIGTPTYTYDLARLLVEMIQTDKYGYYHATNEGGFISWADFAEEIFRRANKDVKVKRVTTAEYGASVAKRPFNSRLDKSKLVENGFKPLPDWKDAVRRYLEEIKEK